MPRSIPSFAAVAAAAVLGPAALAAQRPVAELGGFVQPTFYDNVLTANNSVGFGGRIGVFATGRLSIEAEGSYSYVDAKPVTAFTYTPLSLRALYHVPTGARLTTLVGVGAIRSDYRYSHNYGAEGLAGAQLAMTRRIGLRVDATAAVNPGPRNTNTAVRAGLSWMLGRLPREERVAATAAPRAEPVPVAPAPMPTPAAAPVASPTPAPARPTRFAEPTEVHFGFDKATLGPAARATLDRWMANVTDRANTQVQLDGHTDQLGSASYNQRLSERRAAAVRRYLVARGFRAENMSMRGHGKTQPVDPARTKSARAKNRRADVRLSLVP